MSLLGKIKQLDLFGEDVGFTVGDGGRSYNTWFGTLMTVFIYIIIGLYGYKKFSDLTDYSNTVYMTNQELRENKGEIINLRDSGIVLGISFFSKN